MSDSKSQQISIRLPVSTGKLLAKKAKELDMTISQIIRRSIRLFLEKPSP